MFEPYLSFGQAKAKPTLASHEICLSILNSKSLKFVAANAPDEVVSSFELQRHRLASFSLGVASTILVRQLIEPERTSSSGTLSPLVHASLSKTKSFFWLVACMFNRFGLAALRFMQPRLARQLQFSISANILKNVGNLLTDTEAVTRPMVATVTDQEGSLKVFAMKSASDPHRAAVTEEIQRALNASLPNDLARLIFLATLRDNNSGHYYHPEVARRFSDAVADQAMLSCHRYVYEKVVGLSIEDLTDQLELYVTTVPVPRERLLESWAKLRAYRATIPMDTDAISAEIFFMKVEVAVAILEARLPGKS